MTTHRCDADCSVLFHLCDGHPHVCEHQSQPVDGAVIPCLGFLRQRIHLDPELWPETIRIHGWYDPSTRYTISKGKSDIECLPLAVDTYLIQGDNLTIVS